MRCWARRCAVFASCDCAATIAPGTVPHHLGITNSCRVPLQQTVHQHGAHLVHLQQDGQQVLAAGLPVELLHAAVADERRVQRAEVVACGIQGQGCCSDNRRNQPPVACAVLLRSLPGTTLCHVTCHLPCTAGYISGNHQREVLRVMAFDGTAAGS